MWLNNIYELISSEDNRQSVMEEIQREIMSQKNKTQLLSDDETM